MWDLSKHEQLEMELLEGLNSIKILPYMIFCGGTMLRLCHELNRYSIDLDFWLVKTEKSFIIYNKVREYLEGHYRLKHKRHTRSSIVFEFALKGYPRNLKIEVRKTGDRVEAEEKIAFSKHSSIQVFLKGATLPEMMKAKVDTFLERVQIRDVFDIEFLLRKGISLNASKKQLMEIQKLIKKFKPRDYTITLGSLLDFKERQYYKAAKFRFLLSHIENSSR